ncbi:SRPBCC family protein [Halarchaeum sp. CBA1220]|uniref:SRPBCC domain-containing protein n=1 Tax=Halarchaeum sp. CBA1220 TaxID=1853682 RepID=UPI000F3AA1C1|nr:SRPBCC domain-containing protein [Halarchaeum sp. CBA1220]QLC33065.1 SRPBCC family protein [Halarchaeum sp. CBA1220]
MPASVTATVTVEHAFDAPPRDVWVALSDPGTVGDALPGCASLSSAQKTRPRCSLSRLLAADPATREARCVAEGERYDATLAARVRDAEAALDGTVAVTERDYPRLAVESEAHADEAAVAAAVSLTVADAEDGCRVTLSARADVSGVLAAHGRRPVEAAAARCANAFFEAVEARLAAVGGPESERAVKDPDWRA